MADEDRVECGCRHQAFGVRFGRPPLSDHHQAYDLLVPEAQLRKHLLYTDELTGGIGDGCGGTISRCPAAAETLLAAEEIKVVHTGVQKEGDRFSAEFVGGASDDERVVDILSIQGCCFELYRQTFALKHIGHGAKTLLQLDDVMLVVEQQIEVA